MPGSIIAGGHPAPIRSQRWRLQAVRSAWKPSYRRRLQIENLTGMLRDKGGLEDKWCRSLGLGARFVGTHKVSCTRGQCTVLPMHIQALRPDRLVSWQDGLRRLVVNNPG